MNNTLVTDTISQTDSVIAVNGSLTDSIMQTFTPQHWISWFDSTAYHQFDTISYIPSVFSGHKLHPVTNAPVANPPESRNWLFGVLFIITILYLYIQNNFYNRFSQVKRAFLAKRYYSQLVRDGNIFKERIVIPIYLIFLMGFSLLLYSTLIFTVDISTIPWSKFNMYLMILLGVVCYQFLKSVVINLSGEVFYTNSETSIYLLDTFLFISLFSMFLIPLMWLHTYSPTGWLLLFIWSVFVVFSAVRIVKAIMVWRRVFTFFKLFLYLCTLEILPIVIIAKALMIAMKW
jgi:hypothetical protein